MLKCSKTLKIALLLAGVYAAFMAVLLTEISSAKYQETRTAYTNFGAATFNAVILNKTEDGYSDFNVFEEPVELSQVSGYRPGMSDSKNTAQQIPFTIANGEDAASASEVSVQYEIRLRTTGHLPLQYTLRSGDASYIAQYEGTVSKEGSGTVWHEQRFYLTEEDTQEVTFELQGGTTEGKPNAEDYTLIVEWPVTKESEDQWTNDVKYMKEVDLLELFVVVTSKNMLDEDGYGSDASIQVEPGTGIVILDPAKKTTNFVHTLDYRAFAIDAKTKTTSYSFVIENGVGKGMVHSKAPSYTFEIEVPYTTGIEPDEAGVTSDPTGTAPFSYTLADDNGSVSMEMIGYRLYDMLYGKGAVEAEYDAKPSEDQIKAWSQPESQYKLYRVYRVNNGKSVTLKEDQPDQREYRLVLTSSESATISKTKLESVAFHNKIDIIVTADTGGQPSGGGDAGA